MAAFRSKLFAFWLLLVAAILALPVAVLTTCSARGEYVPGPEERFPTGPAIRHGLDSLLIGSAVGVPLAVMLGIAAWMARRKAGREAKDKPDTGSIP